MSEVAERWAATVDTGDIGVDCVVRHLASISDDDGWSCTSIAEVAHATALSFGAVNACVEYLKVRGGIIQWDEAGKSVHHPALYVLDVPFYESEAERHFLDLHWPDWAGYHGRPEVAAAVADGVETVALFARLLQQSGAVRLLRSPMPARLPVVKKYPIPASLRWAVFERDGFVCQTLGCGSRRFLEADHIVPESLGGPTALANLQTLCGPCNRRKAASLRAA